MPAPALTLANRSNFSPLTARVYPLWRAASLTLLSGQAFRLEREKQLFLHLAGPQAGQHWLDAGCSTGFYAALLAAQGCRVTAADLSPAMLRAARQRHPSGLIEWVQADLHDAPWRDATFDGITVGATLNEAAWPASFLHELERLLKPCGQMWLMFVPASASPLQNVLSRTAGLHFPDLGDLERWLPHCTLTHAFRTGDVQFALMSKRGA